MMALMRTLPTLLALSLAVLLPTLARADLPTGEEANRQAREAFAIGSRAFDLGKWDQAIQAWQHGYELKPDPTFLYNIAQAERLAERYDKALFFYHSYLRNAPEAKNRAEVEQRIARIEVLVRQKKATDESPPNAPLTPPVRTPAQAATTPRQQPAPTTTPPPATAPATPPPAATSPPPQPEPAAVASAPAPSATASTPTATLHRAATPRGHRADLTVTGGVKLWLGGVPGGAQPSTGVTLSGGYAVLARPSVELRLGALVGYTYLVDLGATDHFLSLMVDPVASFNLWRRKLYARVEVGLGALVVSGVPRGSALLRANAPAPGTLAAFALRPAVGLEYRVHERFSLFVMPSVTYAPLTQANITDKSLLQFDASVGGTLRL